MSMIWSKTLIMENFTIAYLLDNDNNILEVGALGMSLQMKMAVKTPPQKLFLGKRFGNLSKGISHGFG